MEQLGRDGQPLIGEDSHLRNWAVVAVVSAVQSVAEPLGQDYVEDLVKHSFSPTEQNPRRE